MVISTAGILQIKAKHIRPGDVDSVPALLGSPWCVHFKTNDNSPFLAGTKGFGAACPDAADSATEGPSPSRNTYL
jgi:hypothetical protein